ncbi:MAG TPA: hypothetical protein VM597_05735 [Gemmataceae bacterium]|jgi:hypothetical protein|nr:hypothetical protein [Gemmataceae bacterium]
MTEPQLLTLVDVTAIALLAVLVVVHYRLASRSVPPRRAREGPGGSGAGTGTTG